MSEETEDLSNDTKQTLAEKHFNLISQAYDDFNSKRYEQSLETLIKLEHLMDNDCKVVHNKAVVEFYNSGFKEYKNLYSFLNNELNNFNEEKDDEFKKIRNIPVLYFNKAIILYHLKKPYIALKILESILEKIDELDKSLLSKAGLLFLTILFETNQFKRAYAFLKKFESHCDLIDDSTQIFNVSDQGSSSDLSTPLDTNNIDNIKKGFKLLSFLINIVNGKNTSVSDEMGVEFSFAKAYQYFIEKDFQMASKQFLKKFSTETFSFNVNGEDPDTYIANNMGIIHLKVRHYSVALQFFQHAISFNNKIIEKIESDSQLHLMGASKKAEILYNMGITLLYLQRPKEAFDCFLLPLDIYNQNPRLWLRIAEACIMIYEKNRKDSEKEGVFASTIGSGMHKKCLLQPTPKIKSSNESDETPKPTLEFASKCLRNAVTFAEYYKAEFINQEEKPNELENNDWKNVQDKCFCNPSVPITKESLNKLLTAIYAAYSFVSIRIGDFVLGLENAKKLLCMENLSDANKMLGHLYCAEALTNLNNLNDARTYLEPKFVTNLNPKDFDTVDWEINSLETAQAVLRYNLVVTLVLQGEFGVAKALLVSCNHPILAIKCKKLKMFIDLASDNTFIDNTTKLKNQRF